ncbi:MAG: PD-(D/E)XK nuclease family protein, partial [Phycisphaerae bacterium]|nr:PD-(D/E)XK nuclease family protein [Phycisphaerae bacterium]
RELPPSTFWRQFAQVLDQAADRRSAAAPTEPVSVIPASSPRKVVEMLARWARHAAELPIDPADASALYQALVPGETGSETVRRLIDRCWPALSYANRPMLSPAIVTEMFGTELLASASQLETYAQCPFRHFARYSLRLQQRPEPQVSALDLGNLYHQVLERLVRRQIERRQPWNRAHRPKPEEVAEIAAAVAAELRSRVMLVSARNQFLASQAQQRVQEVLDHEHTAGQAGSLRPLAVELSFGFDDSELAPLSLQTSDGRKVLLRGRIDRVDGGDGVLAAFDYKSQHQRLVLNEVYHGLAIQLLTYLLVLQSAGHQLLGRDATPIGAFYVGLLREIESVDHPTETHDPQTEAFALHPPKRGVFRSDAIRQLDASADAAGYHSPIVNYRITKSGEPRADGDDLSPDDFALLLDFVREKISQMAGQILDGRIDVRPRRLGNKTPCSSCEYRALCRFDFATGDRYLDIPKLDRDLVLELIREKGKNSDA